jgi:NAD(P)H-hydrate epimerase
MPQHEPKLTREQVRAVDRHAIDDLGIPSIVLMENAGRGAAEIILERLGELGTPAVHLVAGRGNNGGDAFVVARHLMLAAVPIRMWLAADEGALAGDAAINCRILRNMGVEIRPAVSPEQIASAAAEWSGTGVIVDGLLGTGFSGDVREPLWGVIVAINASRAKLVVALDVPSGLDCDTGRPGGAAVEADLTITFVARKVGLNALGAARYTGEVRVVGIGAPVQF